MLKHFGAVEADFQSEYGLDLRDSLWGEKKIGTRRLCALVLGVSPRGAIARALTTRGADWSTIEELLAVLVEQTDFANRLFVQANAQDAKIWDPIKINRPTRSIDADAEAKVAEVK